MSSAIVRDLYSSILFVLRGLPPPSLVLGPKQGVSSKWGVKPGGSSFSHRWGHFSVASPPPPSLGFQRTLLRFCFPFERDVLMGRLEGGFPFATFSVPRRIVFVFVTTSDVHDTCEPSTCTCKTTRGARDKVETKKQVVSWNKETVPPAW